MANLARTCVVSLLVAGGCKKSDDFQVPPFDLIDAAIDAHHVDARPDAVPLDAFLPDGAPDAFFDHMAPVVNVVSPQNGLIYAGPVPFTVTIMDIEKITSVTATIAGTHVVNLTQNGAMPNEWDGSFDSNLIAGVVAPSVLVRATNAEGQTTDVTFLITLDNQPPIASLDPPKVRSSKMDTGGTVCSQPIDPLSPDAPNDTAVVAQLIEFRARVVDLPNSGTVTSTLFIPKSGVKTVNLFVLDDTTKPIVVDTDGDGFCDSINPNLTSAQLAQVTLAPIGGAGGAVYSATPTFTGSNAMSCGAVAMTSMFMPLCGGEPAQSVVIKEPITGVPEVYGIPPVDGNNCMGFAFDVRAANVTDGWACAAVAASDNVTNRSVSPPLRVCVDSNQTGLCANAGPPPNCTGTLVGANVTSTPCTFRPSTNARPQLFKDTGSPTDLELIPE